MFICKEDHPRLNVTKLTLLRIGKDISWLFPANFTIFFYILLSCCNVNAVCSMCLFLGTSTVMPHVTCGLLPAALVGRWLLAIWAEQGDSLPWQHEQKQLFLKVDAVFNSKNRSAAQQRKGENKRRENLSNTSLFPPFINQWLGIRLFHFLCAVKRGWCTVSFLLKPYLCNWSLRVCLSCGRSRFLLCSPPSPRYPSGKMLVHYQGPQSNLILTGMLDGFSRLPAFGKTGGIIILSLL